MFGLDHAKHVTPEEHDRADHTRSQPRVHRLRLQRQHPEHRLVHPPQRLLPGQPVEGLQAERVLAQRQRPLVVQEPLPQPGEMVFSKNKPSLFFGTGLLPYLIAHRIDSLIICGGTSSGCIYATAVDGFSHNFKVAVVADATFDRIQTAHWVFLADIDMKYGDVTTVGAAIDHLKTIKMN